MITSTKTSAILECYLPYTAPVQWVSWWANAKKKEAKALLRVVLFEAKTERLRNLKSARVKKQVCDCILSDRDLGSQVLPEAKAFLHQLEVECVRLLTARRTSRPNKSPQRNASTMSSSTIRSAIRHG
jgi:hypothetical protein